MTIEQLQKDMIASMKAGEKVRKGAISSLIAAVKKYAIDNGTRDNITEEITNMVILNELKAAKEQIDTCPADRVELLAEYTANYEIIKEYAPKQLSEEEVKELLLEKFADVIATKNKGMIMKTVMAELKGKADGKVINKVVADLC